MVKDQRVNKKENLLSPHHGLLFVSFICINPRQDSTYHDLCYTSCRVLAGKRNSSVGPPGGIDPVAHLLHERMLYFY